ncbi:MAG: right-handed parallel beta-helix repeat-containing protein [candidate division KSB1 bacterium]|nr:right-handed parallel beta-helix repeat-containing protein [candidate division KSB1 bacterium]
MTFRNGLNAKIILLCLLLLWGFSVAQEPPVPLNVYWGEIPRGDRVFYVAPEGNNNNPGTEELPWASLEYAVNQARPGDVFVMRGGIYYHTATIKISRHGTSEKPIIVVARPGEVPILDFSAQAEESSNNGVRLNAWYWHLVGLTVRYAGHNGIRMDGSYNVLEQVTAYGNRDTGIHMAGNASHNLILNCDSFFNFDVKTAGENADGFGAKFDILPGNRFVGCRAWANADDGFDFWRAANTIIVENCWAFKNGDPSLFGNPPGFGGDGNGFKLGGDYVPGDHLVVRSMAFDNLGPSRQSKGFDHNNNTGALTLIHNTAFNNGRNFYFPRDPVRGQSMFVNNLSVASSVLATLPPNSFALGNSWQGLAVNQDVFLSVDTELAKAPRQMDGSLPNVDLLRPRPGSVVIDRGVVSGDPFCGSAPDVGAYEYESGEWVEPYVHRGSGTVVDDLRVFDIENADAWCVVAGAPLGAQAYGEASHVVLSIPSGLQVEEWIQPSLSSRTKNYLFTLAEFVTRAPMELFVAHSELVIDKPDWLKDYENTGMRLTIGSASGAPEELALFRRQVGAGEQVILGRNAKDQRSTALMYLVFLGSTSQGVAMPQVPPRVFRLLDAYPNPFSARTTILFSPPQQAEVEVSVFDALGRHVGRLYEGSSLAETHAVVWDASGLPSGVYYCRMNAGNLAYMHKLLLVR